MTIQTLYNFLHYIPKVASSTDCFRKISVISQSEMTLISRKHPITCFYLFKDTISSVCFGSTGNIFLRFLFKSTLVDGRHTIVCLHIWTCYIYYWACIIYSRFSRNSLEFLEILLVVVSGSWTYDSVDVVTIISRLQRVNVIYRWL